MNLLTYADLLEGGSSGRAFVAGDTTDSVLVRVQSRGDHFANLPGNELEILTGWIDAGAPPYDKRPADFCRPLVVIRPLRPA